MIDGALMVKTFTVDPSRHTHQLSSEIYNLKEQAITERLISLGWTPPEGFSNKPYEPWVKKEPYTFDDMSLGETSNGGTSVTAAKISRAECGDLSQDQWYVLASHICCLINHH